MKYCHECGSEITDAEAFCPFCGIALESDPADSAAETEAAQEKTIAVSQSEIAGLVGNAKSAAEEETASTEMPEIRDEAEQPTKSEEALGQEKSEELPEETNSSSNITEENRTLKTDSGLVSDSENDVKEPVEESYVSSKTTEEYIDLDSGKDSETEEQQAAEPAEEEVPESEEIPESVKDLSSVSENDVPKPFILDADEKSILEIGETEEEEDEPADDADFSNTIPYTPENILLHSGRFKKDRAETAPPVEEKAAESPIEIPDEPIEMPENQESQFDSVKILQDKESDIQTLLHPEETSLPERPKANEPQAGASAAHAKTTEQKEGGSHTAPNFAGSETDGSKKGAKLKPLEEGVVLNGRYEIVRKIGGGGMGAVYLASDRNLGGILRAVKEMVQSYIEEEAQEKAISDFKRESMLLTSLDHPSIPTIYDYFFDEKENRFYLVMKYISGGDLASRLRSASEGRIDEASVTEWAIQIADVLDYLHNRQPPIVYRDLKPSNIMIDGNSGRVMLIDFGIARWINKEEKGVTAVGTMGYAPPELFSGNVEPRSDIYSLGSTMFHLLTGADPQSNPLLIFDFQKHPRPRQINPQLSDQMEKILMRAVEYNASNRFKSAAEMREVLTEHLQTLKKGGATFGISKTPSSVALSDQTVFCGFCGQNIVATDLFCAFCGSKQPLAQQGVHSAEYVAPLMTARLLVVGTSELESPAFTLEKDDNLLGRRDPLSNIFPEIDLSKFDPQTKVSRRHARIWREGGTFLIEDLGSSNGTVITRVAGDSFRLIPHQPHPLTNGERLKVGDTTLHFIVG